MKLNRISKSFENVKAVDEVSFNIEKGEMYGLLGPNGAGKTTIIRMMMGILEPDEGEIILDDHPIQRHDRRKFGYLPEERGLYQNQKLKESLMYFGRLRGGNDKKISDEIDKWLNRFGFAESAHKKIKELSKGNQQKIQFILALLHYPEFVILDEPFTGLDPINQLLLKEIIKEKNQEGVTVIFSTHQMEQVERLCSNICLIDRGKVIVNGPLSNIKEKHGNNTITVKYEGTLTKAEVSNFIPDPIIENDELSGELQGSSQDFIHWLNEKVSIHSFEKSTPSLEQIFIEEVRGVS
ncbi:MAG: ABC transporter ATP-binding protein [Fidelibacterota bacterium]